MGGGGLLGGFTDFVGLTDYSGAEDRANNAAAATARATGESLAIARENIAFQKEQYQEWKDVYGDIQENLGEYYKNLSGSTLASKQLQAQASEYSRAQQQVTQQLAQRGISGSGIEAATAASMGMQSASQRATIRAGADDAANLEKMKFLGLGLGQGTQMLGLVGNASNTASSNVLQGGIAQGNQLMSYANTQYNASAQMTSGLLNAGGSVLGGMMAGSDSRLKENLVLVEVINGINFYTWEWNSIATSFGLDTTEPYGVIAQEVIDIYPEVVLTMGNGYYAIDYSLLYEILGVDYE